LSRYWEYFFLLPLLPLGTLILIMGIMGGIIIIVIGGITGGAMPILATIMIVTGTPIVGLMDTSATAESILTIIMDTEDIEMTNISV